MEFGERKGVSSGDLSAQYGRFARPQLSAVTSFSCLLHYAWCLVGLQELGAWILLLHISSTYLLFSTAFPVLDPVGAVLVLLKCLALHY